MISSDITGAVILSTIAGILILSSDVGAGIDITVNTDASIHLSSSKDSKKLK